MSPLLSRGQCARQPLRSAACCARRKEYHHYGLWRPKVVFTIHNAEYGLERIGKAAYYSQRFTTVSPSYAREVSRQPALPLKQAPCSRAVSLQQA